MKLMPTIGIYITMNPGYAGRSELPDNLKALFRPVVMVVPELLLICENMLMSEGFTQAKVLAKKMTVLYRLAQEQLSKQHHYDFQLRALKSVLVMAGQLKRQYSDMPEDVVLMRALRDMNMPKFVFDDVPLFYGLISDLFPSLKAERVGNDELRDIVIDQLDANRLKHNIESAFEDQVNKVIQLYETIGTRHSTMVVGPTGAGKTVIIETLASSLKEQTDIPTVMDVINPKMITIDELYGVLDNDTRDWTDGLLSKIFKQANVPLTDDVKLTRNWIIYDGDVDAVWIENMNSVMDDSKLLTLTNGDRIPLQKRTIMLFEVMDLQYASPATISRCGMVYVDPKNLGYEPYYQRWLRDKFDVYGDTMRDSLKDLFSKYVPPIIDRIYEGITGEELVEPLRFITPRTNLNLVEQLCNLIDTVLGAPDDTPMDTSELDRPFLFCLTWSLGGCLVMEDREKFNLFVGQLASVSVQNLYEVYYDMKTFNLDTWKRIIQPMSVPEDGNLSEVIVPTVDTTRYSWLLKALCTKKGIYYKNGKKENKFGSPVLFVGDSGCAKTVTVQYSFKLMEKEIKDVQYTFLNINFSSRTTSGDFQTIIEENIEKKNIKNHGPKGAGKKMIMFIDDLNMPSIDIYGT
jgi:dynein heavy chain